MATYIATCNQNFNELGFQFHVPIDVTRTVYYGVNGQNYTTSGNLYSANITWTGYDVSDDGLFMYVAADRTSAASISPLSAYSTNQAAMLPAGTAWKKCVYGNGSFVSVCTSTTSGAYMRHKEGIGWTASTLPSTAAWSLLAFGNNTFVTVAPSSTSAARSTNNGLTWSAVTLPASLVWVDLKFYNGIFILIANGSRDVYTSTDGSTWNLKSNALPAISTWKQLAWVSTGGVDGTWAVVPSTGATAAYSTDNGTTWTSATLPGSGNWIVTGGKTAFDGIEMFTALTISSTVGAYSYDGINWSLLTITSAAYNEKLTVIKPRIMSGDTVTVNNGATVTVNTNQNVFLAGASALLINNGKVVVENASTTTPIRFGTGRTAVTAALSSVNCANGLGSFEANGNFIEIGTSTGAANQTFTSPYTTGDYIPTVFVETSTGSGVYEPWTNVSGAPVQNQFNYFRNGLRSVGKETPSFIQDFDVTAMQYKFLANTNAIANTNIVTCTSTAGLIPGTWVYSRSLSSGVAVVQDILDSTRFTVNTIITYTLSSSTAGFANIPMVAILPVSAQNTSTLRFGDNINGKIIPTGCKVRVPNIMLTDYSPANFMNAALGSTNAPFCMRTSSGGGSFTLNNVLLGESYSNFSQASKVIMTDVGASYTPFVSECYQVAITNVGFALPPVKQVVGAPTALGATGACTAASATVTIPASSAIIPGVLLTGTGIHAATVTTVNSTTSLTISTVAHTTSASVVYSYYGVWVSRDHRMLAANAATFGSTFTNAPWSYVSNININGLVMTFGGHSINGANTAPGIGSTWAGLLNFGYSKDVTVNNLTGIHVGSYPKSRSYNTAITPNAAGTNHKYTNIKLYNINGIIGTSNVAGIEVSNISHRNAINNEGYNWASLCRVFSDVKNSQFIPKDTKYWFKTRSYKTNDFHDTTGYIDSVPMCSAHGNFDKYLQMPQRFGVLPTWSTVTAPALAYGNGKWVFLNGAVASGAQTAMVSADNGATWTAYMLPSTVNTASVYWRDVIFSPTQNIFMAIGGGGGASTLIAISTDGMSWGSVTTAPASAQWQKLAFDNTGTNKWVGVSGGSAVSTAGTYATITNGSVVFAASTLASAQWINVTSNGAGRFVAIAGGSADGTATSYSINGSTWTAGGAQVSSLWQSIAYGSAKYVAISASAVNGPTSYSTDGVAWTAGTAASLPTGMVYNEIIWTGTVFVALAGPAWGVTSHSAPAVGQFSSAFCTSTNGITWSALKYLPEHTSWIGMANNGNAVGVISTQTGRFAYTADISITTPTWTLTSDVMSAWNRLSLYHQSTEFTTGLGTAAAVATTVGSTTMTCTSTAGLQVGTIMTLANGTTGCGAIYFAAGTGLTQVNAVIVTSITNATTFVVDKPALRTASGLTGTFYKQVYQVYRSTTSGFTARDATTLIGATASITSGQMIIEDHHGLAKDTTYYYRVRKLSGGGTASVVNCSGTAAASTITTVASLYYWQASFDIEGLSGTNVLTSLVYNFFANGVKPGCIITGPGIPVGTTVVEVPDFDTITLSANLTADVKSRGIDRTYVGISPAPGMYIFGSNVGIDAKVVTINSATSMTVSVANTNTFTNQTLRFVVGEELPEIACIPKAPAVIQNNALQSTTLATTWVAAGVTATNAAVFCPLDNFVGTGIAAPAGTGCTVLATAANGTLTQSIKTGVGSVYTFSCYARVRHPDLRSYLTFKMKLGTGENTHTLTNQWTRYSVTFTTIAGVTNAVFTIPAMGTVVEIANAMVTIGSTVPCPIPANTTTLSYFVPQQSLAFTNGLAGYFLHDAPAGIVTNLQTAPTGQMFAHLHVDTASNFTVSDSNQVYSTESGGTDVLIAASTGANNVLVSNYTPLSQYIADRNTFLWLANGCNNIKVKSADFPLNGSLGNFLGYTTAGYNVYVHDVKLINQRNYIDASYLDASINNASNNIKLQNIVSTLSGKFTWANQSLVTSYKGIPGGDSVPLNNATLWNLSTNPTQDSIPITGLAAVYDSLFHEMTFGQSTKGCLDLRFVPSSKVVKPYTIVAGNPLFDSAGGLFFNTNTDVIDFEWQHKIKGVTGFSKRMPHIYGVDVGLSPVTSLTTLIQYDIDRGSGYTNTWKRINSTAGISNLASETALDPDLGFKIKFRISARNVMKYTGQGSQFKLNGQIRNGITAALSTSTAVVIEDETVTTNTTGSIVCNNITGSWATGDIIYSGVLGANITATTNNSTASMTTSTISGTTLTVGTLASGTISVGMLLTGTGVLAGTYIKSNIAGSGTGSTWKVNFPQGVISTTITGTTNPITVDSTVDMYPGMGFRVTAATGSLAVGTTYYVLGIIDSTSFTSTTALFGSTATTVTTGTTASVMTGIHGTITATNTVGVFGPQPTSKLMAMRLFTEINTSETYFYPYSTPTITFTGLKDGSEVRAYIGSDPAIAIEIGGVESSVGNFVLSHSNAGQVGYIQIFALGYLPVFQPITYGDSNISIPVIQSIDRVFANN